MLPYPLLPLPLLWPIHHLLLHHHWHSWCSILSDAIYLTQHHQYSPRPPPLLTLWPQQSHYYYSHWHDSHSCHSGCHWGSPASLPLLSVDAHIAHSLHCCWCGWPFPPLPVSLWCCCCCCPLPISFISIDMVPCAQQFEHPNLFHHWWHGHWQCLHPLLLSSTSMQPGILPHSLLSMCPALPSSIVIDAIVTHMMCVLCQYQHGDAAMSISL